MTAPVVSTNRDRELARARELARLLDAAFRIPGTQIRFGLDSLIGLFPGIGDLSGLVLSGLVIYSAVKLGAPRPVLFRMLVNVGIDTVVGSIPLLGDLFDVGFRANQRNVDLLQRHLDEPARAERASRRTMALIVAGVLVVLALLVTGGVWLARGILARL